MELAALGNRRKERLGKAVEMKEGSRGACTVPVLARAFKCSLRSMARPWQPQDLKQKYLSGQSACLAALLATQCQEGIDSPLSYGSTRL